MPPYPVPEYSLPELLLPPGINCTSLGVLAGFFVGLDGLFPAAESTPKLPCQDPRTLMNRTPNQSLNAKLLLMMLSKFTLAFASPLVASPAIVLLLTSASPLLAATLILLVIVELFVALISTSSYPGMDEFDDT